MFHYNTIFLESDDDQKEESGLSDSELIIYCLCKKVRFVSHYLNPLMHAACSFLWQCINKIIYRQPNGHNFPCFSIK